MSNMSDGPTGGPTDENEGSNIQRFRDGLKNLGLPSTLGVNLFAKRGQQIEHPPFKLDAKETAKEITQVLARQTWEKGAKNYSKLLKRLEKVTNLTDYISILQQIKENIISKKSALHSYINLQILQALNTQIETIDTALESLKKSLENNSNPQQADNPEIALLNVQINLLEMIDAFQKTIGNAKELEEPLKLMRELVAMTPADFMNNGLEKSFDLTDLMIDLEVLQDTAGIEILKKIKEQFDAFVLAETSALKVQHSTLISNNVLNVDVPVMNGAQAAPPKPTKPKEFTWNEGNAPRAANPFAKLKASARSITSGFSIMPKSFSMPPLTKKQKKPEINIPTSTAPLVAAQEQEQVFKQSISPNIPASPVIPANNEPSIVENPIDPLFQKAMKIEAVTLIKELSWFFDKKEFEKLDKTLKKILERESEVKHMSDCVAILREVGKAASSATNNPIIKQEIAKIIIENEIKISNSVASYVKNKATEFQENIKKLQEEINDNNIKNARDNLISFMNALEKVIGRSSNTFNKVYEKIQRITNMKPKEYATLGQQELQSIKIILKNINKQKLSNPDSVAILEYLEATLNAAMVIINAEINLQSDNQDLKQTPVTPEQAVPPKTPTSSKMQAIKRALNATGIMPTVNAITQASTAREFISAVTGGVLDRKPTENTPAIEDDEQFTKRVFREIFASVPQELKINMLIKLSGDRLNELNVALLGTYNESLSNSAYTLFEENFKKQSLMAAITKMEEAIPPTEPRIRIFNEAISNARKQVLIRADTKVQAAKKSVIQSEPNDNPQNSAQNFILVQAATKNLILDLNYYIEKKQIESLDIRNPGNQYAKVCGYLQELAELNEEDYYRNGPEIIAELDKINIKKELSSYGEPIISCLQHARAANRALLGIEPPSLRKTAKNVLRTAPVNALNAFLDAASLAKQSMTRGTANDVVAQVTNQLLQDLQGFKQNNIKTKKVKIKKIHKAGKKIVKIQQKTDIADPTKEIQNQIQAIEDLGSYFKQKKIFGENLPIVLQDIANQKPQWEIILRNVGRINQFATNARDFKLSTKEPLSDKSVAAIMAAESSAIDMLKAIKLVLKGSQQQLTAEIEQLLNILERAQVLAFTEELKEKFDDIVAENSRLTKLLSDDQLPIGLRKGVYSAIAATSAAADLTLRMNVPQEKVTAAGTNQESMVYYDQELSGISTRISKIKLDVKNEVPIVREYVFAKESLNASLEKINLNIKALSMDIDKLDLTDELRLQISSFIELAVHVDTKTKADGYSAAMRRVGIPADIQKVIISVMDTQLAISRLEQQINQHEEKHTRINKENMRVYANLEVLIAVTNQSADEAKRFQVNSSLTSREAANSKLNDIHLSASNTFDQAVRLIPDSSQAEDEFLENFVNALTILKDDPNKLPYENRLEEYTKIKKLKTKLTVFSNPSIQQALSVAADALMKAFELEQRILKVAPTLSYIEYLNAQADIRVNDSSIEEMTLIARELRDALVAFDANHLKDGAYYEEGSYNRLPHETVKIIVSAHQTLKKLQENGVNVTIPSKLDLSKTMLRNAEQKYTQEFADISSHANAVEIGPELDVANIANYRNAQLVYENESKTFERLLDELTTYVNRPVMQTDAYQDETFKTPESRDVLVYFFAYIEDLGKDKINIAEFRKQINSSNIPKQLKSILLSAIDAKIAINNLGNKITKFNTTFAYVISNFDKYDELIKQIETLRSANVEIKKFKLKSNTVDAAIEMSKRTYENIESALIATVGIETQLETSSLLSNIRILTDVAKPLRDRLNALTEVKKSIYARALDITIEAALTEIVKSSVLAFDLELRTLNIKPTVEYIQMLSVQAESAIQALETGKPLNRDLQNSALQLEYALQNYEKHLSEIGIDEQQDEEAIKAAKETLEKLKKLQPTGLRADFNTQMSNLRSGMDGLLGRTPQQLSNPSIQQVDAFLQGANKALTILKEKPNITQEQFEYFRNIEKELNKLIIAFESQNKRSTLSTNDTTIIYNAKKIHRDLEYALQTLQITLQTNDVADISNQTVGGGIVFGPKDKQTEEIDAKQLKVPTSDVKVTISAGNKPKEVNAKRSFSLGGLRTLRKAVGTNLFGRGAGAVTEKIQTPTPSAPSQSNSTSKQDGADSVTTSVKAVTAPVPSNIIPVNASAAGINPTSTLLSRLPVSFTTDSKTDPRKILQEIYTSISRDEIYIKTHEKFGVGEHGGFYKTKPDNHPKAELLLSLTERNKNGQYSADLNQGSPDAWQSLLLAMKYANDKECSFSLGNNATIETANDFIRGLLSVFPDPNDCHITFKFDDENTAQLVLQALQRGNIKDLDGNDYSETTMGSLRSRFGLRLTAGIIDLEPPTTHSPIVHSMHYAATSTSSQVLEQQNIFKAYLTNAFVAELRIQPHEGILNDGPPTPARQIGPPPGLSEKPIEPYLPRNELGITTLRDRLGTILEDFDTIGAIENGKTILNILKDIDSLTGLQFAKEWGEFPKTLHGEVISIKYSFNNFIQKHVIPELNKLLEIPAKGEEETRKQILLRNALLALKEYSKPAHEELIPPPHTETNLSFSSNEISSFDQNEAFRTNAEHDEKRQRTLYELNELSNTYDNYSPISLDEFLTRHTEQPTKIESEHVLSFDQAPEKYNIFLNVIDNNLDTFLYIQWSLLQPKTEDPSALQAEFHKFLMETAIPIIFTELEKKDKNDIGKFAKEITQIIALVNDHSSDDVEELLKAFICSKNINLYDKKDTEPHSGKYLPILGDTYIKREDIQKAMEAIKDFHQNALQDYNKPNRENRNPHF